MVFAIDQGPSGNDVTVRGDDGTAAIVNQQTWSKLTEATKGTGIQPNQLLTGDTNNDVRGLEDELELGSGNWFEPTEGLGSLDGGGGGGGGGGSGGGGGGGGGSHSIGQAQAGMVGGLGTVELVAIAIALAGVGYVAMNGGL